MTATTATTTSRVAVPELLAMTARYAVPGGSSFRSTVDIPRRPRPGVLYTHARMAGAILGLMVGLVAQTASTTW